jgi:hypothetical protein
VNTTAQVGGALGLAVLATLSSAHTKHLLATGHSNEEALTGGYHLAFWIAAALVAAAIAVALRVSGAQVAHQPERAAQAEHAGSAATSSNLA